jgi:ATP-binding cassette, subfamily F, member 3
MTILSASNISKAYGTDVILKDVNFSINENEKIGLVGKNGAGKTTIFKMISGSLSLDSGDIFVTKDKKIGYLSQNLNLDENTTVFEETLKVFDNLIQMEQRLRELEKLIAHHSSTEGDSYHETLLKEYGNIQDEYERNNGYGIESFARSILVGLGISTEDFNKEIKFLSGGQKTRVALSKLLLESPDILLLDEPTNHLDLAAIDFLEGFLRDYRGTIIIISHDRYFLDIITTKTYELIDGIIEEYNGNYSYYVKERENRYKERLKDYELQQREIQRLEEIIEQFRSFNREKSIKQAESREKSLEKIERIDKPKYDEKAAKINFDVKIKSGNDVLLLDNISKSFGDNILFENLSFMMKREERVALIGENGKGKTTIFKIICESLEPDAGFLKLGKNVKIGYYDQEQKNLSINKTVLDEVWDEYPDMTVTQVRNTLGAFLFKGDDVFKTIDTLSGGERCRLSLLKLMISNSNFLLLDEPTNHLDIMSREALEDALLDYPGTLLVISHDRYFLNKVINKIIELENGTLVEYLGNFEYYHNKKNASEDEIIVSTQGKTKTEAREERRKLKELQDEKKKLENSVKTVEKEILMTETRISELEAQLCLEEVYSNPQKSIEVNTELIDTKKILEQLYEKWQDILVEIEE